MKIRALAPQTSRKDDFLSCSDGIGWQSRILRQREPIHLVAYDLDPARVPGKIDYNSRKLFHLAQRSTIQAENGRFV
jgi:hypothetical protein